MYGYSSLTVTSLKVCRVIVYSIWIKFYVIFPLISKAYLWKHFNKIHLTIGIRRKAGPAHRAFVPLILNASSGGLYQLLSQSLQLNYLD